MMRGNFHVDPDDAKKTHENPKFAQILVIMYA